MTMSKDWRRLLRLPLMVIKLEKFNQYILQMTVQGKLNVNMLIDSDFEFSKNSTAQLYEAGLIGGKAIAIIPAFDGAPNVESGDTTKLRCQTRTYGFGKSTLNTTSRKNGNG